MGLTPKIRSLPLDIEAASAVQQQQVTLALASPVFLRWLQGLDERFVVESLRFTAVDFKGKPSSDNVLFIRMAVKTPDKPHAQIVELRGDTVVMLVVLTCEGEDYTVLTKQARLATGNAELVELPAGMVDNGTFKGAVANELRQELGLVFSDSEMIDLTPESGPIYFSPGLLDEAARFYLVRRTVSRDELNAMQGKETGAAEEFEKIILKVVPLAHALHTLRDGKAFIAFQLYGLCGVEHNS